MTVWLRSYSFLWLSVCETSRKPCSTPSPSPEAHQVLLARLARLCRIIPASVAIFGPVYEMEVSCRAYFPLPAALSQLNDPIDNDTERSVEDDKARWRWGQEGGRHDGERAECRSDLMDHSWTTADKDGPSA